MNPCVFQLVFLLCVEYEAVLIKKAHNGSLPSGAAKEINDNVKEPILKGRK
jgi:hypothetical protein